MNLFVIDLIFQNMTTLEGKIVPVFIIGNGEGIFTRIYCVLLAKVNDEILHIGQEMVELISFSLHFPHTINEDMSDSTATDISPVDNVLWSCPKLKHSRPDTFFLLSLCNLPLVCYRPMEN